MFLKKRPKGACALLVFWGLSSSVYAQSTEPLNANAQLRTEFSTVRGIPNFLNVTEQIFRGGRPNHDDLALLKQSQQIRTVIDLEDKSDAIAQERRVADSLSLDFLSSPMNAHVRPTDEQVNKILADLQDAADLPVFIHCFHGQDRTGLIVGLFRVEVQGWAPADAYQEMLHDGFHSDLTALDGYFRDRTGYTGP